MESDFTHLLAEESTSCGGSVKLTPLQVHVKRRETERQVEFRLHSHAYLKQLEDDEAWLQLQPSFPGEGLAEEIYNTITCSPAPNQVTLSVSPVREACEKLRPALLYNLW